MMTQEEARVVLWKVAAVFEMWMNLHNGSRSQKRLEELAGSIMLGLRGSVPGGEPDSLAAKMEEYRKLLIDAEWGSEQQ